MKHAKAVAVAVFVTLMLLAALAPQALRNPSLAWPADRLRSLPLSVAQDLVRASVEGKETLDLQVLLVDKVSPGIVQTQLSQLGATVRQQQGAWLALRVPVQAVADLVHRLPVAEMEPDASLSLAGTAGAQPLSRQKAAEEFDVASRDVTADTFRGLSGATGAGVTIAVVDTGVDPGHVALQKAVDGKNKLADWVDFTTEGRVRLTEDLRAGSSSLHTSAGEYQVAGIPSASGHYRFGVWYEAGQLDLNRNGTKSDRFGVLLTDSKRAGVYDTIYLDTQGARDFRSAQPLHIYREDPQWVAIGNGAMVGGIQRQTNVVVADLDPKGSWVKFGFDANGHGTHVAGIAAANDPAGFAGYAPGAQVMALKVAGADGQGRLADLEAAINYAITHGAQIISISLQPDMDDTDRASLSRLLRFWTQGTNSMIVMPSGNMGPGLSSVTAPTNVPNLLVVGGYYEPKLVGMMSGYRIPSEGIYPYSGVGPAVDGSPAPDLVAPAVMPSSVPTWMNANGYGWMEGTSQAVPNVAGALALLLDAARSVHAQANPASLLYALRIGARSLAGTSSVQQGQGLLNLDSAWVHLRHLNSVQKIRVASVQGGSGLLARESVPALTEFDLTGLVAPYLRVNLVANQPWMQLQESSLLLPDAVPRASHVTYTPPTQPGLYTGSIAVHGISAYGLDVNIPTAIIRPYRFDPRANNVLDFNGTVALGEFQRYFVTVPEGAVRLTTKVEVPIDQRGKGQVIAVLCRPDGREAFRTHPVGYQGAVTDGIELEAPMPGVWEVVVFSPLDSAAAGANAVPYHLNLQLGELAWGSDQIPIVAAPRSQVSGVLSVTNRLTGFTGRIAVVGLQRVDEAGLDRTLSGVGIIDRFTLTQHATVVQLAASSARGDAQPLLLYVYRYVGSTNDLRLVAASPVLPAEGAGSPSVQLTDLPPGEYRVLVEAPGATGMVTYQYRRQMGISETAVTTNDALAVRPSGISWSTRYTLMAPEKPGRYFLQAAVIDDQGTVIGWKTFPISVGQPAIQVTAMAGELVQGRPGWLTLLVMVDGHPIDGTIMVDGAQYEVVRGEVHVPVKPDTPISAVHVTADLPAFQPLYTIVSYPAYASFSDSSAPQPQQDQIDWRRKLVGEIQRWRLAP